MFSMTPVLTLDESLVNLKLRAGYCKFRGGGNVNPVKLANRLALLLS